MPLAPASARRHSPLREEGGADQRSYRLHNLLQSRGVRCSKNDLYGFLDYLTDAYLVFPVPIHSRSEKARQVNPKKLYLIDTGLLGAMSFGMTEDKGALLENLVHLHLRRQRLFPEYFVSETGNEVDFVLPRNQTGDGRLIQVCWSLSQPETKQRELRSLHEAMEQLDLKHGTILTWLDDGSEDGIEILPVWKWLLTMEAEASHGS